MIEGLRESLVQGDGHDFWHLGAGSSGVYNSLKPSPKVKLVQQTTTKYKSTKLM